MKILKTAFLVLGALTTILSCRNDDEDTDNFNMNRKFENVELQASRIIKDSIYNTTNGDPTLSDTIKPGGTRRRAVLDSLKTENR